MMSLLCKLPPSWTSDSPITTQPARDLPVTDCTLSAMFPGASTTGWDATITYNTYGVQRANMHSFQRVSLSLPRLTDCVIPDMFSVYQHYWGSCQVGPWYYRSLMLLTWLCKVYYNQGIHRPSVCYVAMERRKLEYHRYTLHTHRLCWHFVLPANITDGSLVTWI